MTLPNILALTDAVKACFETLRKCDDTRVDIPGTNWKMQFPPETLMDRNAQSILMFEMEIMRSIAMHRLGPPGGPAPVEGGSFDWEVRPGVTGGVHFIIKSYTDQRTVEKLQRQYLAITEGNRYDFR